MKKKILLNEKILIPATQLISRITIIITLTPERNQKTVTKEIRGKKGLTTEQRLKKLMTKLYTALHQLRSISVVKEEASNPSRRIVDKLLWQLKSPFHRHHLGNGALILVVSHLYI